MSGQRKSCGFTLIELILFIVVTSISVLGIIPLYNNILTNLHVMDDGIQAKYLGIEMVETLKSVNRKDGSGFASLIEANFPAERGIDIGGQTRFDRFVTIEGMIMGQLPTPCTKQEYNGEANKCIYVSVTKSGSSQTLWRDTLMF